MKIAMTSISYHRRGGIARYVAELAERIGEKNEVHVFSNTWKDVQNPKVEFHKVRTLPGPLVIKSIPYTLQNTIKFRFSRGDYDIIHTNGCDSTYSDVITTHSIHKAGIEFKKNNTQIQGLGFHDLFALSVEKLNYSLRRNYKKLIADATSGKRELMEYYNVPEEDIEVIPLGVDLEEFKPGPKDSSLRNIYGISDEDIVLIIVATEFYRKGMTELIESLNILCNKGHKNIKLLIIGKAEVEGKRKNDSFYRELIKKYRLTKNVIFAGLKYNSKNMDLTKHYNLADIFVFPTKYEGFGIPTVEAMACELPVIVGPSGAGEDLIENGKNGFLLDDVNNPQEIADKILILSQDEKLRKTMGKAARKTAQICSWGNITHRTIKLYEEILRY